MNDPLIEDICAVVAAIPRGKVTTYGEIARLIGRPQNSRLVGRTMGRITDRPHIPCHRVVNSQGRLAPGWDEQRDLLLSEGVTLKANGNVDMKRCAWRPFDTEELQ
jgi:methylated-DNA-protein-cysteine methyltransferase-like protein